MPSLLSCPLQSGGVSACAAVLLCCNAGSGASFLAQLWRAAAISHVIINARIIISQRKSAEISIGTAFGKTLDVLVRRHGQQAGTGYW
ncbi:MAG: hypothetical protein ACR2PW_03935 [Gammaproteobacteria bacterium]